MPVAWLLLFTSRVSLSAAIEEVVASGLVHHEFNFKHFGDCKSTTHLPMGAHHGEHVRAWMHLPGITWVDLGAGQMHMKE